MTESFHMSIETKLLEKIEKNRNPRVAIVSVTKNGSKLADEIRRKVFPKAKIYSKYTEDLNNYFPLKGGSIVQTIQYLFKRSDLLILIMATGIVVRSISSIIQDKLTDPAIVVLDEQGKYVISLLSGHVGNANYFTKEIAREIDASPVITTATDVNKKIGIDDLAMQINAIYDSFKEMTYKFNMMIADNKSIALINDAGIALDQRIVSSFLKYNSQEKYDGIVLISNKLCYEVEELFADTIVVQLIPRQYVLGVGCRKDTPRDTIIKNFKYFLEQQNLNQWSISKIVSIDIKKEEDAINYLAQKISANFETFDKNELVKYETNYPGSTFVKKTVGVSSVAQTSAHHETNGKVLTDRYANNGVTFALAKY